MGHLIRLLTIPFYSLLAGPSFLIKAGKETALDIVERKLRAPLADVVDKEEEEARRKELEKVASYLRNYQTAVTVSHGGSSDVTIIPQQGWFQLNFRTSSSY